jgi:uncharacterized protein CbrC (UPF0167 family)
MGRFGDRGCSFLEISVTENIAQFRRPSVLQTGSLAQPGVDLSYCEQQRAVYV